MVLSKMRLGMTPQEAVDQVALKYGLHKDGSIYKYLLRRAKEQ